MDALGRSDRSSGSLKGRRSVVSRGEYPRDVIEIVMTGLLSVNSNLPFSSVFVPAPVPAIFTVAPGSGTPRSEEHTSELQSLMRISYAVFCLKKKKKSTHTLYKKHNTIISI